MTVFKHIAIVSLLANLLVVDFCVILLNCINLKSAKTLEHNFSMGKCSSVLDLGTVFDTGS